MSIQEIIQKIQNNDPNLKIVKLPSDTKKEDRQTLYQALENNTTVEELDFSDLDLKPEVVVTLLPKNTNIKKVTFKAINDQNKAEFIKDLEISYSVTFDIYFGGPSYRYNNLDPVIRNLTARNRELKKLRGAKEPATFSLREVAISRELLDIIQEHAANISSLDFTACRIEPDLLKELFDWFLATSNIQEMSLKNTDISDDVLDKILSSPKKITLSASKISTAGKQKIVNALKIKRGKVFINLIDDDYTNVFKKTIDSISERNKKLADLEATELDLSGLSLDERDMPFLLDYLQQNNQLKTLKLNNNNLNANALAVIAEAIKNHRSLSHLEVDNNPLGNESASYLVEITKNPNLAFLSLRNAELTDISSLTSALEENTALNTLLLSGNFFGNAGATALSNTLRNNKTITQIELCNNGITDTALVREIILRKETKWVGVGGNKFSIDQLEQVADAFNATVQTKKINLFTQDELEEQKPTLQNKVRAIEKRNELLANKSNTARTLDLSNSFITIDHVDAIITCLKNNPQINSINLSNNNLGDDGVINLIQGIQRENLSIFHLDLSQNNIGDTGAQCIGEFIKQNRSLVKLDLSTNNISDPGATDIAKSLSDNNTLSVLELGKNPINATGVFAFTENLLKNRSLTSLDFGPRTIGENEVTHFCSAINPKVSANARKKPPRNGSLTHLHIGKLSTTTWNQRKYRHEEKPFDKTTKNLVGNFIAINKANKALLFNALSTGNLEKFKKAFGLGVSPYTTNDINENTPLHLATEREHNEIVEYLLSQGVTDIPNKLGKTALDIAKEKNNTELADLLSKPRQIPTAPAATPTPAPTKKRARSKPTAITTPAGISSSDTAAETTEALQPPAKRMRVTSTEDEPETMEVEDDLFSILYASENKQETDVDVLKIYRLVKNGVALQQDGEHALLLAVQNGWYRIMKIILASPYCDANAISTALAWAKSQHNQDMVNYIEAFQKQQEQGLCWVKSLNVTFGGRENKTVVVEGNNLHANLALQNTFTQQRLAQPLKAQEEETAKDADGNPVTASLTFVVSNGRHYRDQSNQRTTITVPLNFIPEFHITHADEIAYQERLEKRMELGGTTIYPEDPMYARIFHHGEQALLEHLEQDEIIHNITGKLLEQPSMRGAKIYGVVLDIATPRYPCNNCQIAIRGEQQPDSEFLEKLKLRLISAGCKVPQFNDLRMITRVGSYQAFETNPMTPEEHQQTEIDMRFCGNNVILSKDLAAIPSSYTQFTSRQ